MKKTCYLCSRILFLTRNEKTKDELLIEKDAEIKCLRKAQELERFSSHAYSTMIDLADQTFNIHVRKNWDQTVILFL